MSLKDKIMHKVSELLDKYVGARESGVAPATEDKPSTFETPEALRMEPEAPRMQLEPVPLTQNFVEDTPMPSALRPEQLIGDDDPARIWTDSERAVRLQTSPNLNDPSFVWSDAERAARLGRDVVEASAQREESRAERINSERAEQKSSPDHGIG